MFPNNRDSDFLLEHWLVTERSNKFQTHLALLYPDSREGEKVDDFLALELNRRKEFLEKIVIEKTAALAQSGPEGRLRCVDRNGRPEYYWRKDGKDVTGVYIPVGKREFAAALAQRNYDQAVLNYAKEELRLIKQLAKKRAAHNIESIYEESAPLRSENYWFSLEIFWGWTPLRNICF